MRRPRVYTASKTRHAQVWRDVRAAGQVDVVSTWIDEAEQGQTANMAELWARCLREVRSADALILYRPIRGEHLKGALVEAGIALGSHKPVYFVGDPERYSFLNHPFVVRPASIAEAVNLILLAHGG